MSLPQRPSIARDRYAQLPRQDLVVCASLVQNPANLGGLCRTAEAFRVGAVVVADLALTQNLAFRNLAVSAHHWQPLEACSVSALPAWIAAQQQAGYSAIALDLRADAVPLSGFSFPRRSVLVLGRELTGIPAEIANLCDLAIAIPQFGMVESLNVQTAAAIAMYEYGRQYPLSELGS
ncbi:RNA methyltransferase [Trichocoleus sp. FACHB-591]|uniref:TrmH family RNA methyltransferase n=1 Tax=Trichocoleus sp. FACHB-591 TaxID=2692872 RepID=UPI00168A03B0|nr:RNA methyltransferase [Trichocoleus sp. FACHB-591]MBD2097941.1 RNA methyltransferase [Trichocoleus sp. FACHB-591]